MTLRLNYVAASDMGLVRGNNEDSAYAGPHLLLLADGMGGHAAGEVASQLMVSHMEHLDRDPGTPTCWRCSGRLRMMRTRRLSVRWRSTRSRRAWARR